jgi:DNA invertase Pin-like site-specific DNA recombinase
MAQEKRLPMHDKRNDEAGSAPPIAVLYAAKSTEDAKGSIESQLADCRAAARSEDRRVFAVEFRDEGYSAYTGNRGPGLRDAIHAATELAREHGAAESWVQHSDRLARGDGTRARHLGSWWFRLVEDGVQPRSVQDDDNFREPLRAVLVGERNAEDSKRKAQAVKSGKRRSFERGEWGGGPAPDGYVAHRTFDNRGRVQSKLVIDEARAAIIRLASSWPEPTTVIRRSPVGSALGHRTLTRGVPSRPGNQHEGGQPWYRRRVQALLTNPVYAGAIVWHRGAKDEEINWDALHEPIVSRETFAQVQALRSGRDAAVGTRPRGGRPTSRYLLSKLAECGRCGSPMWGQSSPYVRKDGSRQRRYICANVHGQSGCCDMPAIDADRLDTAVRQTLRDLILDFERFLRAALEDHEHRLAARDREISAALEQIDHLDKDIGLLEADYRRRLRDGSEVAVDLIVRSLESTHQQRKECESRLASLRSDREIVARETPHDQALDA